MIVELVKGWIVFVEMDGVFVIFILVIVKLGKEREL